tara:strand:+ start:5967 stop:6671 length:705 start_codon:yes stop_codon:yes gene_type:complete
MENLRVYLLGGNSVIGQAICGGVLEKFGNYNNDIVSFVRTKYNENPPGKSIEVDEYLESYNYILEQNKQSSPKLIIIISFGVLREEVESLNLSENIKYHLDINTFKTLELLEKFSEIENLLEIHVVSSILGDFIRPSIYSYSVSKKMLELLIVNSVNIQNFSGELYVWKPAFVASRLNVNRKKPFLSTTPLKIKRIVANKKSGGNHYIPAYSVILTKIAKISSPIINWLDKRSY